MDKNALKALIKQVVLKSTSSSKNVIDLNKTDSIIDLETAKFPIINSFPQIKQPIIQLFTTQYEPFISEIQWVSPKPPTFRIILMNNTMFMLTNTSMNKWIAQIEGKKYYLSNTSEEENACEAISRILAYGNPDEIVTPVEKGETPEPPSKKKPKKEQEPKIEEPEPSNG